MLLIERPHLATGGADGRPVTDHRRIDETDLFAGFFEQVTGEPLAAAQRRAFEGVLGRVRQAEREA